MYDTLNLDDLQKLKERILQKIFHQSNALVELLQERQKLSEQAHFRLISIEQLHRLLETSCCYQKILLSWHSISLKISIPVPFISGSVLNFKIYEHILEEINDNSGVKQIRSCIYTWSTFFKPVLSFVNG